MQILVLYSEFNAYNQNTFSALSKASNCHVHVVHWDNTKLTSYEPQPEDSVSFYPRSRYSVSKIRKLLDGIDPSLIFVSGWMDLGYIQVCHLAKKRGITVMTACDTHWRGGVKQSIFLWFFPILRWYYLSYAFVPGLRQYYFARKLGFNHTQILTGLYTANTSLFKPKMGFSKSIIYIGRLEAAKGAHDLFVAFNSIVKGNDLYKDWKLLMIGEGSLFEVFKDTPGVTLTGFLDQASIASLSEKSAFFCLPSWKDQWGLVLHEMAARGLPLLVSNECGAIEDFVIPGFNGLISIARDRKDLEFKLHKMMDMTEAQLLQWGTNSSILAQKNSTEIWVSKVSSILRKKSHNYDEASSPGKLDL